MSIEKIKLKNKKEKKAIKEVFYVKMKYKIMLLFIISLGFFKIFNKENRTISIPIDGLEKSKILEEDFDKYNFEIYKDTIFSSEFDDFYKYSYEKHRDSNDLIEKINYIKKELNKYPQELIDTIGINNIFLVENIYRELEKTNEKDELNGFYTILNSIALTSASAFHHELFHAIDVKLLPSSNNEEWGELLYGQNFSEKYGNQIAIETEDGSLYFIKRSDFASFYGEESVDEDQAETVKYLFENPDEKKMNPILARKIEIVKKYFYKVSKGKMDKQYWKDLRNGVEIDENYWKNK